MTTSVATRTGKKDLIKHSFDKIPSYLSGPKSTISPT